MEDDEGEKKTKTVSFTVYEDEGFDAGDLAVFDALVDREMQNRKCSRTEAVGAVLFTAVVGLADTILGSREVDRIMEEGVRNHRDMTKDADGPTEPGIT